MFWDVAGALDDGKKQSKGLNVSKWKRNKRFSSKKTNTGNGTAYATLKKAPKSPKSKHKKSNSNLVTSPRRSDSNINVANVALPKVSYWSDDDDEDSETDGKSSQITKSQTFGVNAYNTSKITNNNSNNTPVRRWPAVNVNNNNNSINNTTTTVALKGNKKPNASPKKRFVSHNRPQTLGFGTTNINNYKNKKPTVKIISASDTYKQYEQLGNVNNNSNNSSGSNSPNKSLKRPPPPRPPSRRSGGNSIASSDTNDNNNTNDWGFGGLALPLATRGIAKSVHGMDGFAQFIWYVFFLFSFNLYTYGWLCE